MGSLAAVLERPDVRRGDAFAVAPTPALPSGFAALDAELPGHGWPRGALTEILVDGHGFGEVSLLLPALRQLRSAGDWALAIAPPHPLHAPAWAAGLGGELAPGDLEHLVVVSPAAARDALWAAEQALLSGAPRAVLCWSAAADTRAVRRLQVAAGQGGAAAFLFRPRSRAHEPSAAALRLSLAPAPQGALAVTILKRRGPPLARDIVLAVPRPVAARHDHVAFTPVAAVARAAPAACAA
jgi:hypothetical protein